MLGTLRKFVERAFIGDSIPALVRWGKHVPRPVIRGIQADAFRAVVRYAARRQKFFARRLRELGINPARIYSWINQGILPARRGPGARLWVTLTPQTETDCRRQITGSTTTATSDKPSNA